MAPIRIKLIVFALLALKIPEKESNSKYHESLKKVFPKNLRKFSTRSITNFLKKSVHTLFQ